MKEILAVGSLVTVTKSKKSKSEDDGLNKFAGWEMTVLDIPEGKDVLCTHPFGLNDSSESMAFPVNRLKVLGKAAAVVATADKVKVAPKVKAEAKAGKAEASTLMQAVSKGDMLKTKNAWLTVSKPSAEGSKTIVATNSKGSEVRIWREKLFEIKLK